MMTFVNPLDALIPKIPFSFFADFWVWVTSKARRSVSVGFWGGRQLGLLLWESSQGAVSTPAPPPPPPQVESPPTPDPEGSPKSQRMPTVVMLFGQPQPEDVEL